MSVQIKEDNIDKAVGQREWLKGLSVQVVTVK